MKVELKIRRRCALLSGTLLCCVPFAPSQAQDTSINQASAESTDDESVITITGSRLVRPDLSSPSPLTVAGEEDIQLSGNATIENTLLEFPQLASSNNSSVNNGGGSGVLTANLRGLGPTRTLVLTNGRRFIPANADGLVDLTSIPDALVERVEIITGGASAVYGSDAIAGAVNFILRRDFEGFELNYSYGQTFRDDGNTHKIDATFGANFDEGRGNVVFSASYTDRGPVFQADRGFAQVPLDTINGQLVPGGSGNVPGTRIGLTQAQLNGLVGVSPPSGACTNRTSVQFRANGQPFIYCTPENAYNYAPFNYMLRPLERIQVSALARYEFTDNVEVFADVFVMNARNRFRQAPDSFTPITPGAGSQTLLVPNYATNPGLFPAVRQFFIDNRNIFDPTNSGTARVVGSARRTDEIGTRENMFERNSLNLTGGLRGDFGAGSSAWQWEAFYQYQRSRTDTRTEGQVSQSRLAQGLDAVVGTGGQLVCRDTSRGCVPVSIFGFESISPAAATFLTPPRVSNDIFTRQVAGASLSGSAFELPGGPLAVAVGAEYRKDTYRFFASPLDLAGEYGPVSQSNLAGSFDVREIFAEVRIPIFSDRPLLESVAIEGAARYSNYGGDNEGVGGVVTWKLGGEYAPFDWLRFRAAYNRAIRAPTLNELRAPVVQGFSSATDPCAATGKSTAVRALCVAQGVPVSEVDNFVQAALGATARSGGNPNLEEERSKTLTIGGVLSPPFIDRLNITVDYFRVRVDGAIAAINVNQTLSDCFANLDINSVTCSNISRLPNGQLDVISTQLSNIGALKVEGVDAQVDYSVPLPGALSLGEQARLDLRLIASWLFERSSQVITTLAPVDCAGRFGNGCIGTGTFGLPDFKLNLAATYNSGPLSVRAQSRMVGSFSLYPGAVAAVQSASAQWYFDLAATVRPMEHVELYGGIDNLFDNGPPILGTALAGDANTDPSLWDVIGRRFFIGARLRF